MKNYHWRLFRHFVKAELGVGGPDAQLNLLTRYAIDYSPRERVWLIGCYCAHHTSPSAIAVWDAFPDPRMVIRAPNKLRQWLKKHWKALPLRREMRSHQMLEKRTDCLVSFAQYTISGQWRDGDYEDVWDSSINSCRYYGRYMALKYLELLRLSVRPELETPDLRAKHAWSPRITLGLLQYAKDKELARRLADRHDNSPDTIEIVEKNAARLHRRLIDRGIKLNMFQLQVLLCNYKQAITGRFYPGMGLDEERMYAEIAGKHFDIKPIYRLRRRLYDREHLGELNGWEGIRQDQLNHWRSLGDLTK